MGSPRNADPERNYHVFYQLCAGASPEDAEAWRLRDAREFYYLNQARRGLGRSGVSD